MHSPTPMLTVSELDIGVPGRNLVEKLNVDFPGGEVLAILGRNGAGKSLTLHTLAGLRDIERGNVRLNGDDIDSLPRRSVARALALLPQEADDVFPATVYETVIIGRHPHIEPLRLESAEDHEIARQCLRELDLDTLADRDATTLSGGERRRLSIAQTLAQAPSIYLLDEPLNHLDPQHQLDVLDLFASKARNGASIVATLHDANLALRYAQRCLLLFGDGRWQLGATQSVLTEQTLSELYGVRMEACDWRGRTQFVAAGHA